MIGFLISPSVGLKLKFLVLTQTHKTMNYYDSAEGLTISRDRAIAELRKHGVLDMEEFFNEMGDREEYDAQAVLAWQGINQRKDKTNETKGRNQRR